MVTYIVFITPTVYLDYLCICIFKASNATVLVMLFSWTTNIALSALYCICIIVLHYAECTDGNGDYHDDITITITITTTAAKYYFNVYFILFVCYTAHTKHKFKNCPWCGQSHGSVSRYVMPLFNTINVKYLIDLLLSVRVMTDDLH